MTLQAVFWCWMSGFWAGHWHFDGKNRLLFLLKKQAKMAPKQNYTRKY